MTHRLFTLQRQQNCKIQTVLPKPDRPRIFPWISACKSRPIFAIFSRTASKVFFATAREYFSSFKLCVVPDLGNLRPCKWWQLKDILLMIQPIYFTLDLIISNNPMVRICAVSIPFPPWWTSINRKWKWNQKRKKEIEYLCSVNTISTLADIRCYKNLQELYIRLVVGTFLVFLCFRSVFFFSERTKSLISARSSGWGICRDWRICKWSIR